MNDTKYPYTLEKDCSDEPDFHEKNCVIVNLLQTPTQVLTGRYAIIFAYYKLKSVVKKISFTT